MANATRYVGDTGPPLRFQLSDANGVITTLPSALGLSLEAVGAKGRFSGAMSVLNPPQVDPDGIHQWNAQYTFSLYDTAFADTYDLYVTVTNGDSTKVTFGTQTLQVLVRS